MTDFAVSRHVGGVTILILRGEDATYRLDVTPEQAAGLATSLAAALPRDLFLGLRDALATPGAFWNALRDEPPYTAAREFRDRRA